MRERSESVIRLVSRSAGEESSTRTPHSLLLYPSANCDRPKASSHIFPPASQQLALSPHSPHLICPSFPFCLSRFTLPFSFSSGHTDLACPRILQAHSPLRAFLLVSVSRRCILPRADGEWGFSPLSKHTFSARPSLAPRPPPPPLPRSRDSSQPCSGFLCLHNTNHILTR